MHSFCHKLIVSSTLNTINSKAKYLKSVYVYASRKKDSYFLNKLQK